MKHVIIAKNTIYQILTKSVAAFVGFLITVVIARQFGVTGYGDFTKITAYIVLFYLFLDFGINAIFLQITDEEETHFNKLFYSRIFIAFVIFVFANLLAFFLPFNKVTNLGFSPFVRFGIFVYSFSFFTQGIINSATALFQKRLNYLPYFIATAAGSLFNLIFVFVFSYLHFPLTYIVGSFILGGAITSLVSIFYVRNKILPVSLDFKYSRQIIIKSFPIGLMLVFNLIYFRADMFLLSVLRPTTDVGIYGIAYKFFDFLLTLPLFLSNALYPFLLSNKNNAEKFFSLVNNYFFIFLFSSFIVILPFWFLSPLLSLIKTDYIPAIVPFRILLLSLPFFFLTSFLQWILITLGKQRFLALIYFASTFFNIILNIIFIPQFSYIASSIITVVSEGVVFVFLIYKVYSIKIFLEREQKSE